MAVNWSGPLRTKNGRRGRLLPAYGVEKRRRVAMTGSGGEVPDDLRGVTVWLYPESGVARCDGRPSDDDLVGADA